MLANFVQETASAPGSATVINLAGPPTGRRGFLAAFASGASVFYFMDDGAQSEWGIGTVTSGTPNTLSRTTVISNSAGTTARMPFTGTTRVYNEIPAERLVELMADAPPSAWADIASAATTNLGATNAQNLRITGTTTITSFGTVASGTRRQLRFAGALTLTHNATSLILLGGANITTAAGDTAVAVSLGGGNWVVVQYQYADAAAARAAIGAPAIPTASGVGEFRAAESAGGGAYVLPAGGTWAYILLGFNLTTGTQNPGQIVGGRAAGGTNVAAATANQYWHGFAWRII